MDGICKASIELEYALRKDAKLMKTSALGNASAASGVLPKRGTKSSSVPKNNFVFPFDVPGETRAAMDGISLFTSV